MAHPFAIGLDLGGTDLKAGVVSEDGRVTGFARRASRAAESADAPLEVICEAVRELMTRAGPGLVAIGLGAPGVIDPERGALSGRTPHLPHWNGFPLRDRLRSEFGVPVAVDNDANCHAFAEHRLGAARGARVSLTVTLGTGVGGGIVADGRVFRGAHGGAGELGHVPLGSGEIACACGIACCAEPEMSASGLVRAARARGLPLEDGRAVFAAAERGEAIALELVDRMGDRLGASIASAAGILNPDVVVIGGGLSAAGDPLFERVRRAVRRYGLPTHVASLAIVPAALGERAGLIGAGLLAFAAARDGSGDLDHG